MKHTRPTRLLSCAYIAAPRVRRPARPTVRAPNLPPAHRPAAPPPGRPIRPTARTAPTASSDHAAHQRGGVFSASTPWVAPPNSLSERAPPPPEQGHRGLASGRRRRQRRPETSAEREREKESDTQRQRHRRGQTRTDADKQRRTRAEIGCVPGANILMRSMRGEQDTQDGGWPNVGCDPPNTATNGSAASERAGGTDARPSPHEPCEADWRRCLS